MGAKYSQLRIHIDKSFVNDDELSAFVIDNHPLVARQFSAGMNRTAKINLLFEHVDYLDLINSLNKTSDMLELTAIDQSQSTLINARPHRERNADTKIINISEEFVPADEFNFHDASRLLENLLLLAVARQCLFPWERGSLIRLGVKLHLTGAGVQSYLRRVGVRMIPEPKLDQINELIEDIHIRLKPHMATIRTTLRV